MEARLKKLENDQRKSKVSAMLAKARTEGRITPGQVDALSAQGMRDPKWLKGYLATLPKMVRTTEDGGLTAAIDAKGNPLASLTEDQKKIVKQFASVARKSEDEYARELLSQHANKSNGKANRY